MFGKYTASHHKTYKTFRPSMREQFENEPKTFWEAGAVQDGADSQQCRGLQQLPTINKSNILMTKQSNLDLNNVKKCEIHRQKINIQMLFCLVNTLITVQYGCFSYLKSFTQLRINLSPFTKDFRV